LSTEGVAAPGGASDAAPAPHAVDPLIPVVFAVLVVACFAAFFLTQRLKHTPTAVQHFERTPTFSPLGPDPEAREEHLSFKLSSADRVTVTVVDSNLNTVATLLSGYPAPRYKQVSVRWNGRRGSASGVRVLVSASGHRSLLPRNTGRLAPPGEYRVRVALARQGREVVSPWSFTLQRPGR
jgi:hypothetical protein